MLYLESRLFKYIENVLFGIFWLSDANNLSFSILIINKLLCFLEVIQQPFFL